MLVVINSNPIGKMEDPIKYVGRFQWMALSMRINGGFKVGMEQA
jgi:hypothetical protein